VGLALTFALVPTERAVAGLLQWDDGALQYLHSRNFEPSTFHDVRVSVVDAHHIRLADPSAIVVVDTSAPECEPSEDAHAAVCGRARISELQVILGQQPDAFVNATDLPSTVCGAEGSDLLTGGTGNDLLVGGPGRDRLAGGEGPDRLAITVPGVESSGACVQGDVASDGELLDGGAGNDLIQGGPGDDILRGDDGADSLRGFAGDDRIEGGRGPDDLGGFDGDDVLAGADGGDLLFGGAGADRLEGGDGNDLLGATARMDADGFGGSDETVAVVDVGNDVMDGGNGDDVLVAGPGEIDFDFTDPLAGERRGLRDRSLQSAAPNGADVLRGGSGFDEVTYFNRALAVRVTPDGLADDGSGGEGDRVDADVEAVTGGAGDDELFARPEGSFLDGDLGSDRLTGDAGSDFLRGGADARTDVLLGAAGDDDMAGGGGDDELDGGSGRDAIAGDDGEDVLRGNDGDDTLWGGTGADRLEGGAGADCLHGFLGAPGTPALPGCPTFARVSGTSGADGDDVLAGGAGPDRLEGGGGEDVADYRDATGPVLAILPGADAGHVSGSARWADRDEIAADVEGALGGRGADTLLGNAGDNLLDGGPGADQLEGGAGADRLRGGPGPDLAVARDGEADEIRCGTGRDLTVVDGDDEIVGLRADICELADGAGEAGAGRLARVLGRAGCAVRLRLPGVARSFDLAVATVVPWGTRVSPPACGAAVRPPGQRKGRAAHVRGGTFSLERGRRGAGLTLALRGGRPLSRCSRGSRSVLRRLAVTAARTLLVDARSADVRGARAAWTVSDRCDGTRVAVQRGRAAVFGGRRGGTGPLRAPRTRRVPRVAP
jgi:Ca2+-binding RTX toxin-like protein